MLEAERDLAMRLAREAGRLALTYYGGDYAVEMKGASDPVTDADKRVNAYLVDAIAEAFPEDGIVAEETQDQSAAGTRARCWYIDPLDGTKEFIAQNGEFSVMLGLVIGDEAALGVVYQPVGDRLYVGVIGDGAFMETAGEHQPLALSEGREDGLTLVVSRSHRSSHMDAVAAALPITGELKSGSVGLKLGIIARGDAELYVHFSNRTCVWDSCGPEAILRAAGGVVTDGKGERFRYDGRIKNRNGILAGTPAAHRIALPVIREMVDSAVNS